jgi:hypothetical protein
MSSARAWLIPLGLGLLAAGLTYLLVPEPREVEEREAVLTFAFTKVAGAPDTFVIGTWSEPVAVQPGGWIQQALRREPPGLLPLLQHSAWVVQAPATLPEGTSNASFHVGASSFTVHAAEGPRLGEENRSAVRATVYVFMETGDVLASNAPGEELGRFRISPDYTDLGNATWYLGDGAAPPGMTSPHPLIRGPAREALWGRPVGGVGVATIRSELVLTLYGPLLVTAQIDALVAT